MDNSYEHGKSITNKSNAKVSISSKKSPTSAQNNRQEVSAKGSSNYSKTKSKKSLYLEVSENDDSIFRRNITSPQSSSRKVSTRILERF
jgi:hypothetical protein